MLKISQRSLSERATGSRQENPPHTNLAQASGKITGHALENRIVFAVQRQQHGATLAHSLHKERAGHHQRLFIGQQDLFAGIDRGQCRAQPCRANNGGHHSVDFGISRDLAQALLAHQYVGRKACRPQLVLQAARYRHLWHNGESRRMTHAQGQQLIQAREAGQRKYLITIWMASDHIQRTEPDRAGRAQHGHLLQAAHEAAIHNSTAKMGMAAVRLSIRSSTPP